MKNQYIALIPSRLNATRFPNKPLALIKGKPMIQHVWERVKETRINEVVVATEDQPIYDLITNLGGKATITSSKHPSGSDRIYEALESVDPEKKYNTILNIQGDLPSLPSHIVNQIIETLESPEGQSFDILTLATKIDTPEDIHKPSIVKVIYSPHTEKLGRALYFSRSSCPHGEGDHYHHIGLYAYKRAALEKFINLPSSPLENQEKLEQLRALEAGMTIGVLIVNELIPGVDIPSDIEWVSPLIT